MEVKKIKAALVATAATKALLFNGNREVVAAVPPSVGDKHWGAIDAQGRFVRFSGAKLGGLGVEKFLLNQGYVPAEPGDPRATRLLDQLAARAAVKTAEEASQRASSAMQERFAGQRVMVVPFAANKPAQEALIKQTTMSVMSVILGMGVGMSSGVVQTEYRPEDKTLRTQDVQVNAEWICPEGEDPSTMPRVSDYGGPVEEAGFLLTNIGLTEFIGSPHLECPVEPADDDPMPRGAMQLRLKEDGSILKVGIDAMDELVVQLWRNGAMVRERHGILEIGGNQAVNVGNCVGSILGIVVLDAWAQAAQPKKLKKAA
jgi:hypothetical protein